MIDTHPPAPPLHVLLVDDDRLLRSALAQGLRYHYDVTDVGSVEEATVLVDRGVAFDAVVTDVEMPTSGRVFVRWLEEHAPALAARTMVIWGGPRDPALAAWCRSLPQGRFFSKPMFLAALVSAIDESAAPQPGA